MLVCSTQIECTTRRTKTNTLSRVVYNRSPFAKLMIIIEREEKGSFIEIDLFCKSVGIGFASTLTLVHIFFNDFIHYLEYADILNIMLKKERRVNMFQRIF